MWANPDSGIREIFDCGIRNPGFGIRNTAPGIRNPTIRIGIQSKVPLEKTGIKCLESGIHGLESRIQDCLGLPNMRRKAAYVKNCRLRIY